ncbi:MAG TPA: MogA/MoaB family molybdenum cofactor biosynthesis protein [Verrucomicrobiae bacterium]|jgi:molybdopterin adenylyltransferase|nr:MogA/MoaB family molybdenum cofactor biosynthesis protein [Verrucomicrobiae bacterium]
MRIAVLTISDSVTRGEREDLSGPALVAGCRALGWTVSAAFRCSDDSEELRNQLRAIIDSGGVDVLLTTGGTGLGPRDTTPECTLDIADRTIPGIAEEIRRKGLEKTPTALLSRGVAAIRHQTIIINLPGSPKGASESLDAIAHLLPHAVEVLHGAHHG